MFSRLVQTFHRIEGTSRNLSLGVLGILKLIRRAKGELQIGSKLFSWPFGEYARNLYCYTPFKIAKAERRGTTRQHSCTSSQRT